jgi:hypothetical protein
MREIFDDWTIPRALWEELRRLLRPGMATLECGSGLSTRLFDAAGCRHTALEHDPARRAPSESVVLATLAGDPPWYDWTPSRRYDLILIDGPPRDAGGRWGILRVLDAMVHDRTVIVLDDTNRAAESRLAEEIADRRGLGIRRVLSGRGYCILGCEPPL